MRLNLWPLLDDEQDFCVSCGASGLTFDAGLNVRVCPESGKDEEKCPLGGGVCPTCQDRPGPKCATCGNGGNLEAGK